MHNAWVQTWLQLLETSFERLIFDVDFGSPSHKGHNDFDCAYIYILILKNIMDTFPMFFPLCHLCVWLDILDVHIITYVSSLSFPLAIYYVSWFSRVNIHIVVMFYLHYDIHLKIFNNVTQETFLVFERYVIDSNIRQKTQKVVVKSMHLEPYIAHQVSSHSLSIVRWEQFVHNDFQLCVYENYRSMKQLIWYSIVYRLTS